MDMKDKGYVQGDMSPKVEDYQKPMKDFAESQFGKTLNYIERQDRMQGSEASQLRKQGYQGRYS